MRKLVELGPFGCTIDHGTVQSLDMIPEGYTLKNISISPEPHTAIIELGGHPGAKRTPCEKTDTSLE